MNTYSEIILGISISSLGYVFPYLLWVVFCGVSAYMVGEQVEEKIGFSKSLKQFTFSASAATLAWCLAGLDFDLIIFNTTGSFMNSYFLYFGENKNVDEFRSTFFGVWTSFSGLIVIATKTPTYYLATMVLATVSHEAGFLTAKNLALPEAQKAAFDRFLPRIMFTFWIFIFLSVLHPTQIITSIFAFAGCVFGDRISEAATLTNFDIHDDISAPLLCNILSSFIAMFVVLSDFNVSEDSWSEILINEFVESLIGSASALTDTSELFHLFVISSIKSSQEISHTYNKEVSEKISRRTYSMIGLSLLLQTSLVFLFPRNFDQLEVYE